MPTGKVGLHKWVPTGKVGLHKWVPTGKVDTGGLQYTVRATVATQIK